MLCYKCKEQIDFGDACMTEPTEVPRHYHFFHPNCHSVWKALKGGGHVSQTLFKVVLATARHPKLVENASYA